MKDRIAWIELHGFQSHEKTRVEFDEGFNAIVGPSNSGKSGLLRGLRFILFNELEDSNFITIGKEAFTGTVGFASGKTVTRKRNKKDNLYILEKEGEESLTLMGFGEGPVQDVLDFHGIKPVRIGKKDRFISVHTQHEQPFFLLESPADKAKLIGSIAKTDIIDIAIDDIGLDLKRAQIKANDVGSRIRDKREALNQFSDIEERERDLLLVEEQHAELSAMEENKSKVAASRYRIAEELLPSLQRELKVLGRKNDVSLIESSLERICSMTDKKSAMEAGRGRIEDENRRFAACKKIVERVSEEDLLAYAKAIDFLAKDTEMCAYIAERINRLKSSAEKYQSALAASHKADAIPVLETKIKSSLESAEQLSKITAAFASAKHEIGRFSKGSIILEEKTQAVKEALSRIEAEIEANPVCPLCGADLVKQKGALMNG